MHAAEQAVVQHVLARGYLSPEQLRQLQAQAPPGGLLHLLAARLPGQREELRSVWLQAGGSGSGRVPSGPSAAAALDAATRAGTRADPTAALGSPPSGSGEHGLPAVGDRIGPYQVVRELGRGGMGVVFVARHSQLGREVALKMLLGGIPDTEAEQRRFEVEAEATGKLRHPNLVTIHERGTHAGNPWFVMDLIDGPSLKEVLQERGPFEPREACRLVARCAEGIHAAHQAGILHRDLKPANIILGADGEPRVTDFGLARDMDASYEALTKTGQSLGTPAYMAPEQADGDREAMGPRTDVYGLGATLYELLTGRPPFVGASMLNILSQVFSKDPEPPTKHRAGIPADVDTVVLHCLEKEPGERYPSGEALAADLERSLRGEPIEAVPPPLWRRLRRRAKRRVVPLTLVTAVLALALLAIVTRLVRSPMQQVAEESAAALASLDRRLPAPEQLEGWSKELEGAKQSEDRKELFDLVSARVEVLAALSALCAERPDPRPAVEISQHPPAFKDLEDRAALTILSAGLAALDPAQPACSRADLGQAMKLLALNGPRFRAWRIAAFERALRAEEKLRPDDLQLILDDVDVVQSARELNQVETYARAMAKSLLERQGKDVTEALRAVPEATLDVPTVRGMLERMLKREMGATPAVEWLSQEAGLDLEGGLPLGWAEEAGTRLRRIAPLERWQKECSSVSALTHQRVRDMLQRRLGLRSLEGGLANYERTLKLRGFFQLREGEEFATLEAHMRELRANLLLGYVLGRAIPDDLRLALTDAIGMVEQNKELGFDARLRNQAVLVGGTVAEACGQRPTQRSEIAFFLGTTFKGKGVAQRTLLPLYELCVRTSTGQDARRLRYQLCEGLRSAVHCARDELKDPAEAKVHMQRLEAVVGELLDQDLDPGERGQALAERGRLRVFQGRFSEAVADLETAEKLWRAEDDHLRFTAQAFEALGRFQEAADARARFVLSAYERSFMVELEANLAWEQSRHELSGTAPLQRLEPMIEHLLTGQRMNSELYVWWVRWAWLRLDAGDADGAREKLERALRCRPYDQALDAKKDQLAKVKAVVASLGAGDEAAASKPLFELATELSWRRRGP